MSWNNRKDFSELLGKTITDITGLTSGNEEVIFTCSDGTKYLMYHNTIVHGPVKILFTPDEEVGRGTEHLDLKKLVV